MLLAVMKREGDIPGGGFHYMLHPFPMNSQFEVTVFKQMGYIILDVTDSNGERMIKDAVAALNHQIEIAVLADADVTSYGP